MKMNFANLPRVYDGLLLIEMVRIRKWHILLKWVLKKRKLNIGLQNIIIVLTTFCFCINIFGCFFATMATFNNSKNWILDNDL